MKAKNNEIKTRFNLADVLIVVISIIIIAAIAFRVYNVYIKEETTKMVEVEFEISEISSDLIGINKNDKLYYAADNREVGYIEDFTVTESTIYTYNENGELVKASVPGKSTVRGKMLLNCTAGEHGLFMGGNVLLTESKEISFYTMTREFTAKIIKISE